MARGRAGLAEIARCIDDAVTEDVQPKPVREHARRKRVPLRVRQPRGEREAPFLIGGVRGELEVGLERGESVRNHLVTRRHRIAAP